MGNTLHYGIGFINGTLENSGISGKKRCNENDTEEVIDEIKENNQLEENSITPTDEEFEEDDQGTIENLFNQDDELNFKNSDMELIPSKYTESEEEEEENEKVKTAKIAEESKEEKENINSSKSQRINNYEELVKSFTDLCVVFVSFNLSLDRYKQGMNLRKGYVKEDVVEQLNKSVEKCFEKMKIMDLFFSENRDCMNDPKLEKLEVLYRNKKEQINECLKSKAIEKIIIKINKSKIIPKKERRKKKSTLKRIENSIQIREKMFEKKKLENQKNKNEEEDDFGLIQDQEVMKRKRFVLHESVANKVDWETLVEYENKEALLEFNLKMDENLEMQEDINQLVNYQQGDICLIGDRVKSTGRRVQKARKDIRIATGIQNTVKHAVRDVALATAKSVALGATKSVATVGIKHLLN